MSKKVISKNIYTTTAQLKKLALNKEYQLFETFLVTHPVFKRWLKNRTIRQKMIYLLYFKLFKKLTILEITKGCVKGLDAVKIPPDLLNCIIQGELDICSTVMARQKDRQDYLNANQLISAYLDFLNKTIDFR